MGNLLSNAGYEWRFRWMPLPEEKVDALSIESACTSNGRQRILIGGSIPIDCTLQTSNALIQIEDNGHRVSILGNRNQIIIQSSDIILRVEGSNNYLEGQGRAVTLYSDVPYPAKETLQVTRLPLHDAEGNLTANAPVPLEGQQGIAQIQPVPDPPQGRPNANEPSSIRCTWKPREDDKGNGDNGGAGDQNEADGDQDDDANPDSDDDKMDGGDNDDEDLIQA